MTRYDTYTDSQVEPKVKAAAGGAIGGVIVATFVDYLLSTLLFHGGAVPGPVADLVQFLVPLIMAGGGALVGGYFAKHVNRSQPVKPSPGPARATAASLEPPPAALCHYGDSGKHSAPEPSQAQITEFTVPGKRLGRHLNHDPRSLAYLVPETATPTTVFWQRRVPVFDQGNLGSCTGNAAAGVLGTSPFYETLPAGLIDDEGEALKLYSAATALDSFPGTYPPDDVGSDGLSVAKAAKNAGLIAGYLHVTSIAAAHTAIQQGPFIVGVNWYSGMDNPDLHGLVTVSGTVRGGHEFEAHGYDAVGDLWWFTNSWGTGWGVNGRFCMSSADFARLLSEQGDATVFQPISVPTPPPVPPLPTPTPLPTIPADWVTWAKHALTLKGQSHLTAKVAQEIIAAAGQ